MSIEMRWLIEFRTQTSQDSISLKIRCKGSAKVRGVKGTKGYSQEAGQLFSRYDTVTFEAFHGPLRHLFPQQPSVILDVGAGTGRDAGYLAELGHNVVAVEPTDELRIPASQRYRKVEWIDDALPKLDVLHDRAGQFDLIMMTAVWMHLDEYERPAAMNNVAKLLKPKGLLMMSLRHGPQPKGRLMFDVSAADTVSLARNEEFKVIFETHTPSTGQLNARAGVTWSKLAFRKSIG